MSKERSIATLALDGGALCFHFINTVNDWTETDSYEYLGNYEDVIAWCRKVDILDEALLTSLATYARQNETAGAAALQKLRRTRETLYQFFSGIAADDGITLSPSIVEKFNKSLTGALSKLQFEKADTGIKAILKQEDDDLLAPLWPVMQSAYDILTKEEHARIKECATCGWIFLDHTKNNKKRWCSPLTCGTMHKSKRYYQKKKGLAED